MVKHYELRIVVPDGAQSNGGDIHADVDESLDALCGGHTTLEAEGGWTNPQTGGHVTEPVRVHTAVGEFADVHEARSVVREIAEMVRDNTDEEAVLGTARETELVYVD